MKIRVNPLFFAFILLCVVFGKAVELAWTLLALVLHEAAHILMARLRGYVMKTAVLMPYGAMMSVDERFDKTSSVLIGLAGPVMNGIMALSMLGLWWLFPSAYPYTIPFLYANASLALFNLLPLYPLDGSRVVLGFCKNKLRAVKGLQIAGALAAIALFGVFIGSFFFGFNLSYGLIAVFLFYGAVFEVKEESYISVLDATSKNYSLGVVKKCVRILDKTPIVRLYHHVSATQSATFEVVDDNGNVMFCIDEKTLKILAVNNRLSTPVSIAYAKLADTDIAKNADNKIAEIAMPKMLKKKKKCKNKFLRT